MAYRELGMLDEHRGGKRAFHGSYAAVVATNMAAVRNEMTRRGWL
jgi:hypothetical protein